MKPVMIILLALLAATAYGAVPQLINYQGFLTDTDGAPLDTVVSMTFKLYDAMGTPLWTETQPACTVRAGSFNALLGSVVAVPDSFRGANRWLGVTVGGNSEMTPRSRIVSVPYAYRVGTVDGASGGMISGDVNIVGKGNIGSGNANTGTYAFVAGQNDTASGDYSTVGGGYDNTASGNSATVGGGYANDAVGTGAVVAGGSSNHARGTMSVISGGGSLTAADSNSASGASSVIGGGYHNAATGFAATIAGGYYHTASGNSATVSGGYRNAATNLYASVGGGTYNVAAGLYATVPGGANNNADGYYSFAAGRRAKARGTGQFVWADATNADFDVEADSINSFNARASGGFKLYTNTAATNGVTLWANDNTWNSVCDSTRKTNIRRVDTRDILDRVTRLPISRWTFKEGNPKIEHISPMAQDFWNLFRIGADSLTISTMDPSGVALAAIGELAKRNEKLEEEVALLKAQMQTLMASKQESTVLAGNK